MWFVGLIPTSIGGFRVVRGPYPDEDPRFSIRATRLLAWKKAARGCVFFWRYRARNTVAALNRPLRRARAVFAAVARWLLR